MLCSRCSNIVRPVVAIDIDGTLGDYHSHFIHFLNLYLNYNFPIYEYAGELSFGDYFEELGIERTLYRQVKLAYRQGGMKRSMPVYPGARHLVMKSRAEGAEVWLTTTRPYLRLDGIDPDTRFWLSDILRVSYDGLLYDEDKYHILRERIDPERVVAVFDDLPEMYDAAASAFGQHVPWLIKTYYNRAINMTQMTDLGTAPTLVEGAITRWREQYAAV